MNTPAERVPVVVFLRAQDVRAYHAARMIPDEAIQALARALDRTRHQPEFSFESSPADRARAGGRERA